MSTPVNATLDASKSSAAVTVTDDDATPTGVVLTVDVATVAEDADPAPTVTVTATLAGSVTFPVDQTVTVTVGANSDTATSADYAAVTAFDVVITAGTSTGSGSFVLSPVDDVLDEAVEAVSVTGTATGGLTVTDTQIVITDDDDPPVLSVAAATVVEGAAAELTVTLDAVSGRDVTVNWNTAADTSGSNQATVAVDYTAVASTGVTIPAGDTSATVEVSTVQDTVDEPAETFLVVLSTPTNATLDATKSSATVTVTDDDATPSSVVLAVDVATVAEDADPAPTVTVTATLAGSVTFTVDQTVTVTVGANSDTATSADYAAVTAFDVVITAGTSTGSGSFVLAPVDDVLDEPSETLSVTGTATGGLTVTDTQIVITDDDDPPVLSIAAVTVVEGTAAELTVTLDAVSGRAVTVNWNTAADTSGSNPATVAVDYTAVTSTTVTIPAGDTSATVEVSTVQDTVDEPAETFLVVLSTPVNATLDASKSSAVVTVTDDDATPSGVVLSVDVATVAEDADPAPAVTVTATLAGSVTFTVDQTVTVTVGANSDTATSADYAAVTAFDVVITAGTSSGSGSFVLTPVDDALDEPSETLSVTGTATGGLTVTDTQITITDDDDPPVLSIAAVTVVEGTAAELTVTLDAVSGRDVTVNWNTAAGSGSNQATAAVDYTAVASTGVTIPAGDTTATVEVSTVQDTVDEPAETFLVVLSTPVNATLDATKSSAVVTVTDDDATPSGVVLSVDVATVAEDADPAPLVTVTAVLAGSVTFPVDQTVTVTVGANSDTATSADYAAVEAFDVVIDAGTSTGSGSFVLTPVDDALDEPSETLSVTGTATGGLTVTDTQITITDDDDPPVLSIAPVTVVEGTAAELTVTLDAVSGRDVIVNWSTAADTSGSNPATVAVDYTAVTSTGVTIPAGDTSATVEVSTVQDTVDEPAETFLVVLSGPVNATLDATKSSAVVTVTDDDATPSSVVLSVDVATVAEDVASDGGTAPTVTVTATLAGSVTFPVDQTVTVTVGANSDTATSADYAAVTAFDVVITAGTSSGSGSFVLSPVDDVLDEAVEAVSVTGTATGGLTVTDTQITITDDDDPPVLSIAAATVVEGAAAELTVSLDAVSGRDVTVNWNTAADTEGTNQATAAVDYTAVTSTTVTIPAGSTTATVEVSTVQDTVDEPAETFLVVLSGPVNATLDATKSSATVTVTDDDATPSSVVLAVDVATVAEDADPAPTVTVTATLAGSVTFPVDQTVTVTVGANGDTATSVDYAAVTAFDVVITAGTSSGSGSFVLSPVDDVLDEAVEAVSVTGTATGGLTVTDTQIVITDDDDPPVLSIAPATVVEGAAAELTVTLDAVSGRDVTVNWNTAADTEGTNQATVAVDYTAVASTGVTIPAGTMSATVEVSTVQDTVDEPAETFLVVLSTPVNATLDASQSSAVVTVTDDDATPTGVVLSVDVATVAEDADPAPAVTVTAVLAGSVTFPVDQTVTVTVGANSDTATAADYAAVEAFDVVITAGTSSGSGSFVLSPVDDALDEPSETLSVTGTATGGLTVTDTQITITDDDDPPVLSIAAVTVVEGTAAELTVTLDAVSGRAVTVNWSTAADTSGSNPATVAVDYTAVASTGVTIPAGTMSATVEVSTVQDTVDEPAETFLVVLSGPVNATLDATESSAVVTVTDDDATPTGVVLSVDVATVAEDADPAPTVTVTAALAGSVTFPVDQTVTVTVGANSDTATSADYAAVEAFDVVIDAGTSTGSGSFVLTPVDDALDEPSETLSVTGTATGGLTVTDTQITITDDDDPPVLSIAPVTVVEGTAAELTVTLDAVSGRDVTVNWNTAADTSGSNPATVAVDYTAVASTGVTIPAGDTTATVEVSTVQDTVDEPAETFLVVLSTPTNATLDASQSSATVTVTDDDATPSSVVLSVDVATVAEDVASDGGTAPTVTVTATLAGSVTFPVDQSVTVTVGANSDTATSADYAAVTAFDVVITAGTSTGSGSFVLSPVDDALDEAVEAVSVTGTATGGLTVTDTQITITDDDDPPVLSIAPVTVVEGTAAELTVTLDAVSGRAVTVNWNTAADTSGSNPATVAVDYTAVASTGVTIPAGTMSATVEVSTVQDTVDEPAETFLVVLSTPTNATLDATQSTATVTVTDDDATPSGVVLAVDVATVAEDADPAPTVTVTATLAGSVTFPVDQTVTVTVGANSDTATAVDYAAVEAFDVVITAGTSSGSGSFVLSPVDDVLDEAVEAVSVTGTATGGLTVTDTQITITDDDDPPVLSIAAATVVEGAAAELTVTLDAVSGRDVTVNWNTAADTEGTNPATVAVDYTAVASTGVTIPAGDTSATVEVSTVQDTVDEPAETFLVVLSTPVNATLDASKSSATVTVTDDDATPTGVVLTVDVATVAEDADPVPTVTVTATLAGSVTFPVDQTVTVTVGANSDTATSADYAAVTAFDVVITAGTSSGSGSFVLSPVDDVLDEPSETLSVTGTATGGLTVTGTQITITDDDDPPVLSIAAVTVVEGTAAELTVTLDAVSGRDVTVNWNTAADTEGTNQATVAVDYTAVASTGVTIPAGTMSATVEVRTSQDTVDEPAETFLVVLSTPTNATLDATKSSATVTVTDDDATPSGVVLSVDVATVAEDADPAPTVTVTATLAGSVTFPVDQTVTVTVGANSDTATSADYAAVTAFDVVITAGTSSGSGSFVLSPVDDVLDEPSETLSVTGTATGGLTVTGTQITITDDDDPPVLSIAAVTVVEGTAAELTVTLDAVSGRDVTVNWNTAADTEGTNQATVAVDYTAVASTGVTIPAGTMSATVEVRTSQDTVDEPAETFLVVLSTPTNATLDATKSSATVTVTDDDATPSSVVLSVDVATVAEDADPAPTVTVTAVLAGSVTFPVDQTVTVTVGANSDTATSADYAAVTAFDVVITAGTSSGSGSFVLSPVDDALDEAVEAVSVTGTATGGLTVTDTQITITDDDDPPVLSIAAVTVVEGAAAELTVTLDAVSGRAVTVNWSTAADTSGSNPATVAVDYTAVTSTTVTIPAGDTSATVEVSTVQDTVDEPAETFLVVLSTPVNATLDASKSSAVVTVTDDDATPSGVVLAVDVVTVAEDADPAPAVTVTATLAGSVTFPVDQTVTVTVGANSDTATSADYAAVTAFDVVITAGTSTGSGSFVLSPVDDVLDEAVEAVSVTGTATGGLTVTDTQIVITDDDDPPVLSIAAVTVVEGTAAELTVTLDAVSGRDVTVNWSTAADTEGTNQATVAVDYTAVASTGVTIPAGTMSATVEVSTVQDTVDEPAETFLVVLSTPVNATLDATQSSAVVTVTDDDATPTGVVLAVDVATVAEDADPAPTVTVTATLAGSVTFPVDQTVTVTVGANSDTATSADYAAVTAFDVVITAGTSSGSGSFVLSPVDDVLDEAVEAVSVTGTATGGLTVTDTQITITDDDDPPVLSIAAVTVVEGTAAELTVSLDAVSGRDVTVNWNTAADTSGSNPATVAVDYTAVASTGVTIPAGDTTATVEVSTVQDTVDEPAETFLVVLSTPTNATLDPSKSSATVTVTDDDATPSGVVLSVDVATVAEDVASDGGTAPTVTVTAVLAGSVTFTVDQTVTVTVGANSDTATSADYAAVEAFDVVITAGTSSGSGSFVLSPVDDVLDEAVEAVSVTGTATGGLTVTDTQIVITDDDDPPVLSVAPVTVVEGTAAELTVTLDAVSGRDVTVNWSTAADTEATNQATAAVDYTAVASTGVTIPAGSTSATVEVRTSQDTVDEPAETFLVVLSTPVNATLDATQSSAVVTVTDDDATPSGVVLSVDVATVAEDVASDGGTAPTVTVTAVLAGSVTFPVDQTVTVTVGANSDTATSADYAAVEAFDVVITAGTSSGSGSFVLTPVDDALDEPSETLSVTGTATGGLTVTDTQIVITDDDDPPVLSIAAVTVVEGTAAELTVTLDAVSGRDVTVNWNTAADTEGTNPATVAVDYTAVASTGVTIPAGDTSATVEVRTSQDTVDEPDETFLVVLSTPVNATLDATKSSAVVTVTDDDATPSGVVLSVDVATVAEDVASDGGTAPTVTVTAVLAGSVTFPVDQTVTVTVGANSDTATSADYAAVTAFDVVITAGTSTGSGSFVLSPVDDALDEAVEAVSVTGTATGGLTVTDTQITITDDDDPPVLSVAAVTVVEGTAAELTVTLDAVSGRDVTVNWNTAADTEGTNPATVAVDYTAVTSTGVTIPAGSMSVTVEVSTVQDTVDEPAETFLVVLSTPVNATLDASKSSAVVTVTDDDDPPVLSVAAVTVVEGTAAELTVTLDAVSGRDVTVDWNTAAGSGSNLATAAVDYTAVTSTTVTIPAGSMSATVEVSTVQDTVDEPAETFLVVLSTPVNATLDASKSSAVVTVTDDDDPPVLSVAAVTVVEGAAAELTVTLDAVSGRDVTVNWNTAADTSGSNPATAAVDYTAVTSTTVTIPAGSMSATVEVSTVQDTVDEPAETFLVVLSTPVNATLDASKSSAVVTVTDDDDPPVLSVAPVTVVEGTAAELTVTLDAVSGRAVTVNWNTAADTSGSNPATVAVDYTAVASTGVTIPAGTMSATVEVSTVQDTVDEPAETFLVVLSGPVNATLDATQSTATVTVTDDDATPSGVVLAVDVATVAEDADPAPTVTVTATLAGSVTFPVDQTVTVTVGANSDTATAVDYAAVEAFDVVITAGTSSGSGSFVLSPVDDVLDEAVEAVSVTGTATGGLTVTDTQITITDDDDPPVLSIAAATVVEGTAAELTVTLDAVSGRDVTVNWNTAADTSGSNQATVAVDYTAVASTGVTIPAGTMSATVEVSTVQDTVDEPAETFLVVLSTPVNATLDPSKSSATVTVTDDDATPTGVVLSVDVATVAEDADPAPTVTVTATLAGSVTFPVDQTVTVTVGANSDTATSADYAAVTAFDVVITAGTSTGSGSFVLSPVDDVLDEAVEAVSVTGTATGGLTVTDTQITITDDDDPPVLSIAPVTVVEGTAAELTVTLDAVSGRAVTVNWNTAADTSGSNPATVAVDYTAVASTGVTIPAGTMSATVEVSTVQDTVDEPAETFLVVLSTPVNATLDATKSSATVTVTDDDATPSGVVLAVDVVTVAEDADPAPTVTVTATLAGSVTFTVDQTVTVTVGANSDTATSADYAAVEAFDVVITAGTSSGSGSFVLTPVDDALDEPSETLSVTGTATGGLTVTGTQIVITDDDDPPVLSIAAVTVVEGTAAELTVTLDAVSGRDVTVNWNTAADTSGSNPATVAVDYTAVASTGVTIPAGDTSATVEVRTSQDTVDEPDETFLVVLSTPVNATLDATKSSAVVTVTDDDATPSGVVLSVDVATVAEDADPAPLVTVTAVLAGSVTFTVDQTVTVSVGANSDTATSADYAAVTAFDVVITAGTSSGSGSFVLSPVDDVLDEPSETLSVTGTATGGLTVTDTQITITDDDDPPVLSIAAVTVTEGTAAELTVTLDAVSGRDVTVNWNTAAGSGSNQATVAVDYTAVVSTTVTIPAGSTSATVEVSTVQDTVDEPAETFLVVLSTPTNATLDATKSTAVVTITDDDPLPVLSIAAVTVTEGTAAELTVTLDAVSGRAVTVNWNTAADTSGSNQATVAVDYTAVVSTTVTIPAGSTSATVEVSTVQDTVDEPAETFLVVLSTPTNATLDATKSTAVVTITDDDPLPVLSIAAVTVTEGTAAELTVTLDAVSGRDVTVNWNTAADTSGSDLATAAVDYTAVVSTTVTIPAGSTSATVEVSTVQDTVDEPAETFLVVLSTPTNATLDATKSSAVVTVTDDDPLPVLSIAAVTVTEGTAAELTVTLDAVSGRDVTVNWNTAADTSGSDLATAAVDYTAVTSTGVTVPAGSTTATVEVRTSQDTVDEPDETFLVVLSTPTNATLDATKSTAVVTITDDDPLPVLSVEAVSVTEGGTAELTVSLGTVSDRAVTVDWNTAADTSGSNPAAGGVDYTAVTTTETVTIPAGTMSVTVEVRTSQDTVDEPDETFLVVLSAPVNATLNPSKSTATVTITDDDTTKTPVVPIPRVAPTPVVDVGLPLVSIRFEGSGVVVEGSVLTVVATATPAPVSDLSVNFYLGNDQVRKDAYSFLVYESEAWFQDEDVLGLHEVVIPAGTSTGTYSIPLRTDYMDVDVRIWAAMLAADVKKTDGDRRIETPEGALSYVPDPGTGSYVVGSPSVAELKMVDGPDMVGTRISLTEHRRQPMKSGGAARFLLQSRHVMDADTLVNVMVESDGDVLPDGVAGMRTFTIPRGQDQLWVEIPTKAGSAARPTKLTLRLLRGAYTRSESFKKAEVYLQDFPFVDVVTVHGGVEGGSVSFLVSAKPAPESDLDVDISVTTTGDFGFGSLPTSVTIPPSGTALLRISTTDDAVDEETGSVTVTLQAGSGYILGTSVSDTANVTDDDGPLILRQATALPTVSVAAVSSVVEGGYFSFTVTGTRFAFVKSKRRVRPSRLL